MIIYTQRGVRIAEVWYDKGLAPESGADVVSIRRSLLPIAGLCNHESSTLLSDMSVKPDKLLNCMNKENRYEIRRAETRDDVTCLILTRPSLDEYRQFATFYRMFAKLKGMADLSDLSHIMAHGYLENGNLTLTCALHHGEPLVWHSYYVQDNRCRLLNSASHFRDADTSLRSLIGRVNRWLHWKDMLHFKEHNVCIYDWGGWHSGRNLVLLRINQFKESFGGIPAKVYDVRYGITLRGRLENALLQVVQQWRK